MSTPTKRTAPRISTRRLMPAERTVVRRALRALERPFVRTRTLDIRSGSEGSEHDSYSWSTFCVSLNGHDIELRMGGLGYTRLSIDAVKVMEGFDGVRNNRSKSSNAPIDSAVVVEKWEALTGIPVKKFERWYRAAKYRRYGAQYFEPDGLASRLRVTAMIESHRLVTNGTARTFEGKRFARINASPEFRVYRIYGDVTNREELAEAAQELALKANCGSVRLPQYRFVATTKGERRP